MLVSGGVNIWNCILIESKLSLVPLPLHPGKINILNSKQWIFGSDDFPFQLDDF